MQTYLNPGCVNKRGEEKKEEEKKLQKISFQ